MSKIIIVGGVAGGATAAARLRRLNENDEIIMFERDEYISFANCGLPYYIGGVIKDRDHLLVQTVEGMSKRYRLDIRNFSEVVAIHPETKTISVFDKRKEVSYDETYDKLILSPGANPFVPLFDGAEEADNIFTLRNIPDTDKIKNFITENNPKTAVVMGGGFIGLEIAENLTEKGIKVTIVEKLPQVLRIFDFEMAQILHEEMNKNGVNVLLNESVTYFKDKGRTVILSTGREIKTDMVILGIGVVPENKLCKSGNLAIGPRGHILTNRSLQVFDAKTKEVIEDVYAIGDAIEVKDRIDNSATAIPLAWPANRQGRLVADHINGKEIAYDGTLGSSVLKVFDLTAAATGNTEALLAHKGIDYKSISAHRANHATYYPGSSTISMKILYSPDDGRILGAQAIGKDGTDKRIDVIATVMSLNGKISDLSSLELCYAPPFSSAKDPVNVLGYIGENISAGMYDLVEAKNIDKLIEDGGFLLDVRTAVEYSVGKIPGAYNIPVDELRERVGEITCAKDAPIYVTCQVGLRAHIGIMILKGYGYTNLYNLSGGYLTYRNFKYVPVLKSYEEVESKLDVDQQIPAPGSVENLDDMPDVIRVNASGLQCPGPLMATYKAINDASVNDIIEVTATDFGYTKDIVEWCKVNGHTLDSIKTDKGAFIARIIKGQKENCNLGMMDQKNATIVVFSGELDKALAAMIIAQGAVASGKNVTIFFTFWGLNALRKNHKVKTKKNIIEKMFGFMMPRGASKLPLSSMNMLGMGPKMIKYIMKTKNVDEIDIMIEKAMSLGVKFIACTMSMDLMGIKKEELIDGLEYAGVGSYITSNENVGTTLFI
ncbi:MAG: CoA-disulfide reductase [Firmicutes bacterium]|nr:CoA-disulfide reductase [Bacillota bacterium]